MKNQSSSLPAELSEIAKNVTVEKRNEVQIVLNQVFDGVAKMRMQLDDINVMNENDRINMKLANTIRLGVREIRLGAEKIFDKKREEVQQQMLSYKTEDQLWLKSKQTMQLLTKEIEENARWKEETKERFDSEQRELKIQQRMLKVSKVSSEIDRSEFEKMSDETFEIFFAGIEKAFNEKVESERKAEEERIAKEKAEKERIRLQEVENARLKAEAEKREKEIEAERKKIESERQKERAIALAKQQAIEKTAKLEREKAEALARVEAEKRAELERQIEAKRQVELKAEKERLEAEIKAKAEAEKREKEPIKVQLSIWVNAFSIPEINIENDKKTLIEQKFKSFKMWAKNEIENL